jgi:hypothetical protein
MPPSKHIVTVGKFYDEVEASTAAPKRRFVPKRSDLRKWAKADLSGGRATCAYCHETFGMSYMRQVRANWPQEAQWACLDCRESHKLYAI